MFDLDQIVKMSESQLKRVNDIGKSIKIEELDLKLKELEKQTESQEFWSDTENSAKVLAKINDIKKKITNFRDVENEVKTTSEMIELIKTENDDEMEKEIEKNIEENSKKIDSLEISTLLSGKYDKNNAIITIHPGAGGTEAQDWAEM